MRYLLLIYSAEGSGPVPGEAAFGEMLAEYTTFTEEVTRNGNFLGGDALEEVSTATSVRVRDGKRSVTDGPFAETKEVLGGFYLLECEDLDQAIDYAAKIPTARYGTIEVRPVMELPEIS